MHLRTVDCGNNVVITIIVKDSIALNQHMLRTILKIAYNIVFRVFSLSFSFHSGLYRFVVEIIAFHAKAVIKKTNRHFFFDVIVETVYFLRFVWTVNTKDPLCFVDIFTVLHMYISA